MLILTQLLKKMISNSKEKLHKIIILGDHQVGKSTFVNILAKKPLTEGYRRTFGAACNQIKTEIEKVYYNYEIWDSNGSEIEKKLIHEHIYQSTKNYIIMLSDDNKVSIDRIITYFEHITERMQNAKEKPEVYADIIINARDIDHNEECIMNVKDKLRKRIRNYITVASVTIMNVKDAQSVINYFTNFVKRCLVKKKDSLNTNSEEISCI